MHISQIFVECLEFFEHRRGSVQVQKTNNIDKFMKPKKIHELSLVDKIVYPPILSQNEDFLTFIGFLASLFKGREPTFF